MSELGVLQAAQFGFQLADACSLGLGGAADGAFLQAGGQVAPPCRIRKAQQSLLPAQAQPQSFAAAPVNPVFRPVYRDGQILPPCQAVAGQAGFSVAGRRWGRSASIRGRPTGRNRSACRSGRTGRCCRRPLPARSPAACPTPVSGSRGGPGWPLGWR